MIRWLDRSWFSLTCSTRLHRPWSSAAPPRSRFSLPTSMLWPFPNPALGEYKRVLLIKKNGRRHLHNSVKGRGANKDAGTQIDPVVWTLFELTMMMTTHDNTSSGIKNDQNMFWMLCATHLSKGIAKPCSALGEKNNNCSMVSTLPCTSDPDQSWQFMQRAPFILKCKLVWIVSMRVSLPSILGIPTLENYCVNADVTCISNSKSDRDICCEWAGHVYLTLWDLSIKDTDTRWSKMIRVQEIWRKPLKPRAMQRLSQLPTLVGPFTSKTSPPRLNSSSFRTRGILDQWSAEVHSGIEYRKISFNVSASNGPTSKEICFGSADYWTHDDHLLWLKHCHRLTRHELYTRTLWFKCRHCSHLSVPISSDYTNMSEISHLSTSIYAGKQALAFLAIIQGSCGSASQCEDHLLLPSM